jgi:hypothetical protein
MARDHDPRLRVVPVVKRAMWAVLADTPSPSGDAASFREHLISVGTEAALRAWPKWDSGRGERADFIFVCARNAMHDAARVWGKPTSATRWHKDLENVSAADYDDDITGGDQGGVTAEDIEHARAWRQSFARRRAAIAAEKPAYAIGDAAFDAKPGSPKDFADAVAARFVVDRTTVQRAVRRLKERWLRDAEMAALLADAPAPGVLAALDDLDQLAAAQAAAAKEKAIGRADQGCRRARRGMPRRRQAVPRHSPRRRPLGRRGAGVSTRGARAAARSVPHWPPRPRRAPLLPPAVGGRLRSASMRKGGCGLGVSPTAPVALPPSWPPSGARAGPGPAPPALH